MKKMTLPKIDHILLWTVLAIVVTGLFSLSSASSVLAYQRYQNNYFFFFRQLLFGALPGLILMYVFSRVDYHRWQKYSPLLVLAGIGMLVLVLIPGIGFKVGNARRWIDFGLFLFQPVEFVKIAMILYLASWYDKRQHQAHDLYYGYLPALVIAGLTAGLVVLQPDIGSMLVLSMIVAVMFFIGGVKMKYILATAGIGLLVLWILIKAEPYRAERFMTYADPAHDSSGISYQINQSLIAIGSGGTWGVGFGQSRQKYSYLPEPMGDSIFAVMSEELGFARVILVLGLFLIFAFRGFKIARNTPDTFGKLVAGGITAWIVIQALLNIGGITAVIPLTGVPLSLISYGSTSLLITLASLGILFNISRHAEK